MKPGDAVWYIDWAEYTKGICILRSTPILAMESDYVFCLSKRYTNRECDKWLSLLAEDTNYSGETIAICVFHKDSVFPTLDTVIEQAKARLHEGNHPMPVFLPHAYGQYAAVQLRLWKDARRLENAQRALDLIAYVAECRKQGVCWHYHYHKLDGYMQSKTWRRQWKYKYSPQRFAKKKLKRRRLRGVL
jgi:hypothetical protein